MVRSNFYSNGDDKFTTTFETETYYNSATKQYEVRPKSNDGRAEWDRGLLYGDTRVWPSGRGDSSSSPFAGCTCPICKGKAPVKPECSNDGCQTNAKKVTTLEAKVKELEAKVKELNDEADALAKEYERATTNVIVLRESVEWAEEEAVRAWEWQERRAA